MAPNGHCRDGPRRRSEPSVHEREWPGYPTAPARKFDRYLWIGYVPQSAK